MRAARFLTCRMPRPAMTDAFALLEMLCDQADEIAEEGFTSPLRQLMLLGQGRCKMLERNGRLVLAAAAGFFAALDSVMMISLLEARNCAFGGKI